MMTASPNYVRYANDVWLRHILWQTSHHCGTKWSNIIFAKQMHHIAAGDASFEDIQGYALIYLQNYGIIISTTLNLTKECNCMKYISVNKLSDFEFHDAEFAFEIFDNKCLRVKAIYLNIHKDAEQNQHVTDMEINLAYITFEEFNLLSYEPGVAWKQDEHGEFHPTEPQSILTDEYARARFLEQLKNGLTIFDLGEKEPNTYFIDAMSKDPFFTVCFNFKNASIEWDEYNKQAWYVSK